MVRRSRVSPLKERLPDPPSPPVPTVVTVGAAAHAQRSPPVFDTCSMVRLELHTKGFNNYVIKWNKLNERIKTED